jgi:hypothetical protein
LAAKPRTGFLRLRANACPARRAGLIVRPPQFRPEWADEGGHRRALNRSGGLQRSEAGQGHARVLRVTLPRGASDQGKRPAARFVRYTSGLGTHQGRDQGSGPGTDPGSQQPNQTIREAARSGQSRIAVRITHDGDGPGALIGLGAAGTLHPAAFGRCPHPAGNTTRPDRRRRQGRSSSPPTPASSDGPVADRRLRGIHLDPGSGRMVPETRVGRSALRAAAPAERGRCRTSLPSTGEVLLAHPVV